MTDSRLVCMCWPFLADWQLWFVLIVTDKNGPSFPTWRTLTEVITTWHNDSFLSWELTLEGSLKHSWFLLKNWTNLSRRNKLLIHSVLYFQSKLWGSEVSSGATLADTLCVLNAFRNVFGTAHQEIPGKFTCYSTNPVY